MGNDPNKKKRTTGSNYQSYDYFGNRGTVLGGKPSGSITSPTVKLTQKIVSGLSKVFNFGRPIASERPGVKPLGAVSTLKPSGIQPVGVSTSSTPAGVNQITKMAPKFDPVANRAKRDWSGWRPTSFKSIMGGFSGIREADPAQTSLKNLTTGIVGHERFGTFGQTGITNLSQVRPGKKEIA